MFRATNPATIARIMAIARASPLIFINIETPPLSFRSAILRRRVSE
jgi:hypothetical protein